MSWRTPWSHTQPTVGQFSTHIIASYALANGLHQRESKLKIIGDLKLFEPETICLLIAVGDREER
jgi:hypothetical protein